MALRGRRIDNFTDLWSLVGSRGVDIWVLSTSFRKNNIGWPQQPLTEKVLKFNMIFHDSAKTLFFFQNIKIKLNLRACMTLKFSVVIFQALEPLRPQWPPQPQQPPWPQWPLQPHFIKKITAGPMIGSSLASKGPLPVSFWVMDHQNSKFSLIYEPFLSEAAEASLCYFFENWLMKLKCPHLLNPLGTINQ
jgi:hypothetical protein